MLLSSNQALKASMSLKAGEILRSLVKAIIRTPEVGELKIDVRGDLTGILAISPQNENPCHWGWGFAS
jgi:hypothetical protein